MSFALTAIHRQSPRPPLPLLGGCCALDQQEQAALLHWQQQARHSVEQGTPMQGYLAAQCKASAVQYPNHSASCPRLQIHRLLACEQFFTGWLTGTPTLWIAPLEALRTLPASAFPYEAALLQSGTEFLLMQAPQLEARALHTPCVLSAALGLVPRVKRTGSAEQARLHTRSECLSAWLGVDDKHLDNTPLTQAYRFYASAMACRAEYHSLSATEKMQFLPTLWQLLLGHTTSTAALTQQHSAYNYVAQSCG